MKGKLRVMTIITGVNSPYVLGSVDLSTPNPRVVKEFNDELGVEVLG